MTQRDDLAEDMLSSSKAIGANKLLELIQIYSKTWWLLNRLSQWVSWVSQT
jgi:hypothetical protein